jgi:hypothetical protein
MIAPPNYSDLTGRRFGRLIVERRTGGGHRGALWYCKCDCGGAIECYASRLLRHTGVFGCRDCEYERRGASHLRHGHSRKGKTTHLYSVWRGMISRCTHGGDASYKGYGGRGIRVCAEWMAFENFRDWALAHDYAPSLSIERVDPDGNYCPANCEWITLSENKRRIWTARPADVIRRRRIENQKKRKQTLRLKAEQSFAIHAAATLSFGC